MKKMLFNKKVSRMKALFLWLTCICPVIASAAPLAEEKKPEVNAPAPEEKSGSRTVSSVPSEKALIDAKSNALNEKLKEQEILLAKSSQSLQVEEKQHDKIFSSQAYLSASIINSAPAHEYLLKSTEVILDGNHRVSLGGRDNQGLPRNNDKIFFAPLVPGCHEITVKAHYVRLKNDIINIFSDAKREYYITRTLPFIAKSGYRVELEIEGFEAPISLFNWYHGPELRFNRSVRPNFLFGSALLSLDQVLKQGRLRVDYATEEQSNHELANKSLSIDGLPILVDEKHDTKTGKDLIFEAPIGEGKHRLSATLVFAEKKRVSGGPSYNFKLSFERDFYVVSGNTTALSLTGMPKGGFRSTSQESRYARVTSKIMAEDDKSFFPQERCRDIKPTPEEKVPSPADVSPPVEGAPTAEVPSSLPAEATKPTPVEAAPAAEATKPTPVEAAPAAEATKPTPVEAAPALEEKAPIPAEPEPSKLENKEKPDAAIPKSENLTKPQNERGE
jgi:hypothetical protein